VQQIGACGLVQFSGPDDDDNVDREFPVDVCEYCGVFFARPLEYDNFFICASSVPSHPFAIAKT
jgi:hypothetical protein